MNKYHIGVFDMLLINEARTPQETLDLRKQRREQERTMLLIIQKARFPEIIKQLQQLVPSGKWMEFKRSENYLGKFSYTSTNGYISMWFRRDGLISCTDETINKKTKCYVEEQVYAYVQEHPEFVDEKHEAFTPESIAEIIQYLQKYYHVAQYKEFPNSEKVYCKIELGRIRNMVST